MICHKCKVTMVHGVALLQTYTGSPEWPGDSVYTMSPGGPGKMVECLKCPECGRSVSVGSNQREKGEGHD